jgi:thiol-disulfide isomerase/thioredoxin
MKHAWRWLLVSGFLLLAGSGVCRAEHAGAPGSLAAEEFQLENLTGQVVLMDFWASWCEPCKQSLPWLNQLQEKYGDQGLQVVAVNLDRQWNRAEHMAGQFSQDILQVHDPRGILAEARNLQGMPSAFVYDRQGALVAMHVGFLRSDRADREEELEALLSGENSSPGALDLNLAQAGLAPWLRDLLAAPGMAIDPDPIETALDEHIYFSKEASSGGLGGAGGGCGCN